MCGRFALPVTLQEINKVFDIESYVLHAEPSWNIAPSSQVSTLYISDQGLTLQARTWGFLPGWAESRASNTFKPMINARAETILQKPFFKEAARRARCIIPATGYFEWQKSPSGKTPFYISSPDHQIVPLAGLYEGNTCAIVTRDATDELSPIHHRMPLIMTRDTILPWLHTNSEHELTSIMEGLPPHLQWWPVTPNMNSPAFNSPECLEKNN